MQKSGREQFDIVGMAQVCREAVRTHQRLLGNDTPAWEQLSERERIIAEHEMGRDISDMIDGAINSSPDNAAYGDFTSRLQRYMINAIVKAYIMAAEDDCNATPWPEEYLAALS